MNKKKIKQGPVSIHQQQGMVIVVAMLIVALSATLAYFMITRLDRDIYRSRLILNDAQAAFYAQGSVIWAMDQLRNNLLKRKVKHLVDVIPIKSPENVVNQYHISSVIYDMQAKFNLNNLTLPEAQEDFVHLLQMVKPQISPENAQHLANAIRDWISSSGADGKNEFSDYYAKLPVPYRSAHRLMIDVSELKLIKGIKPDIYAALRPYVCVLPTQTVMNIQTASLPVLASLSKTMTIESAKALADLRKEHPFTSLTDFMNLDLVKNHNLKTEKIAVISSYFLVVTNVSIDKQAVQYKTLLERNSGDGNTNLRIVWQSS